MDVIKLRKKVIFFLEKNVSMSCGLLGTRTFLGICFIYALLVSVKKSSFVLYNIRLRETDGGNNRLWVNTVCVYCGMLLCQFRECTWRGFRYKRGWQWNIDIMLNTRYALLDAHPRTTMRGACRWPTCCRECFSKYYNLNVYKINHWNSTVNYIIKK